QRDGVKITLNHRVNVLRTHCPWWQDAVAQRKIEQFWICQAQSFDQNLQRAGFQVHKMQSRGCKIHTRGVCGEFGKIATIRGKVGQTVEDGNSLIDCIDAIGPEIIKKAGIICVIKSRNVPPELFSQVLWLKREVVD